MTPVTPTVSYNHLSLLCDLHKVIGMLTCLQCQIDASIKAMTKASHNVAQEACHA